MPCMNNDSLSSLSFFSFYLFLSLSMLFLFSLLYKLFFLILPQITPPPPPPPSLQILSKSIYLSKKCTSWQWSTLSLSLSLSLFLFISPCPPPPPPPLSLSLSLSLYGYVYAQFWRHNERFETLIAIAVPRCTVYAHFSGSSSAESALRMLRWPHLNAFTNDCAFMLPQNRRLKMHLFVSLRSAITIAVFLWFYKNE